MYLTTKYLDLGQNNRVVTAEIDNGGSMVKLEILSNEPLDETSNKTLSTDWEVLRQENIITLD